MRNNMAASLTETATTSVQPPPGIVSSSSTAVGASSSSISAAGSSSPTKQQQILSEHQQRLMAFKALPPGLLLSGGVGGYDSIRRAASTDDHLSNSQRSREGAGSTSIVGGGGLVIGGSHATNPQHHQQQLYALHNSSNPWGSSTNFADIFRAGNVETEVKQSRNESSQKHRLRSDKLDPMLQQGLDDDDDEDSIRDGSHLQGQRLDRAIFRRPASASPNRMTNSFTNASGNAKALYSPIIGTPSRSPNWSMSRKGSGNANDGDRISNPAADTNEDDSLAWIPAIRPSLSCPTSVFESPLFPSSRNGSSSTLNTIGGNYNNSTNNGLGGKASLLLSQPYRLEKITSASAEPSPSHGSDDAQHRNSLGDYDDDDSDEDSRLIMLDENGLSANKNELIADGHGLMENDLSVIECDEDDFESPNGAGVVDTIMPSPTVSPIRTAANEASTTTTAATATNTNPMRNLSDAFESMVVVDGKSIPRVDLAGLESHSHHHQSRSTDLDDYPTESMSKSGECSQHTPSTTSTKPSPTSILGFDSETGSTTTSSAAAAVTTMQLENGLTVASISMPNFHLHESLRGSLCQGLIDRVSFYSVVRDINKEATDAALVDPRGDVYNDGTVHRGGSGGSKKKKGLVKKSSSGVSNGGGEGSVVSSASAGSNHHPLPPSGKQQVIAEDGKVHVHPDLKEERKCILVMACMSDGGQNNPNEGPSSDQYAHPTIASSSSSTNNGDHNNKASTAATTGAPVALGAALLDEEWWLMSAIASRTPEEVSLNQSSKLLPTFYEAMGEKDAATTTTTTTTVAVDASNASGPQSSRTQLWKPGRSWWEAKSGKNPWVEPVVHNNRWRYLWPLIHYHKFIAKCIKKLKRNGIDVKTSPSAVSLFLRQEVCNVSDHLAFMSKYDSEEWTSALSHFDGWTDHDPTVEETLRALVSSQRLMGVAETADVQSSLLRSQIDDTILKAMQAAKDEAGRDAYDYNKDVSARHLATNKNQGDGANNGDTDASSQQHSYSAHDSSYGRRNSSGWVDEEHLRSAIVENKKRTINDASWSNRSGYRPHPPPYPHDQGMYGQQFEQHPPYEHGYPGQGYGGAMNSQYYHPPHPHTHHYEEFQGQYPPHHHHMGYPPHHQGDMSYHNDHYGHQQYFDGGGYYHHPPTDGSFHEGMVFDSSMHAQDHHYLPPSMAQTPSRYQGNDMHPHGSQYPASPYWGHLNISQLPGIAASPSIHVTPSKPPRGNHSKRFSKQRQQQQQGTGIDGKAKSLLMFHQTNSPASRFVMSPQDKSNPYYTAKSSPPSTSAPNNDGNNAMQEESFVLPTIEDYSPESPSATDKAAGHSSMHSNTSMDLMPPSVKKCYKRQDKKLSDVSEN